MPAASLSASRKVARWATNLLASGLVLIAGLAAGREVLLAWRSSPEVATLSAPIDTGDEPPVWNFDEGVLDLRFGAMPLLVRRQAFSGDQLGALEVLRRHTAALAQEILPRASQTTKPLDDEAARKLLTRTATMTPVAGEPGRWALYEWQSPLPANMVVADRPTRILAWGLALPAARAAAESGSWSLFSWAEVAAEHPSTSTESGKSGQAGDGAGESEEPYRPSGTTLGMSIEAPDGAALATFQARGGTAWIEQRYDQWSHRVGAKVELAWRSTGSMREARFRLPTGSSVLVQLDGRNRELVQGIVTRWPRPEATDR